MTKLINNWLKQIFIHYASSDCSSIPSQHINIDENCLLNETITDRCTIVDKPSTMSDADTMHCNDEKNKNRNFLLKNPIEIKSSKKDTIIIDKFKACFIDCTCQCQARKIIPQINTNECNNIKNQLFEELFNQIRGPSYEIDCCCNCGKKGMRKLKFNYATGDKMTNY